MPKILMRRDTAANWTSANPTLASGEWALETDTGKMKLGDGTTAYNTLSYYTKEDDEWTKPAEWPDIRSGAKDNSVYFLVGHSEDYQTYPEFGASVELSGSNNTYDVYVDGIKQGTYTSGATGFLLNWQTLALSSGYDVTYPAALRTHIVRITPTNPTVTISNIKQKGSAAVAFGTLWIHFAITNSFKGLFMCPGSTSGSTAVSSPVLEAATTNQEVLKLTGTCERMFSGCTSLKTLPVLDMEAATTIKMLVSQCQNLKKIKIKNLNSPTSSGSVEQTFNGCYNIKYIDAENSSIPVGYQIFRGCSRMKNINAALNFSGLTSSSGAFTTCTSLNPIILDASTGVNITRISLGASDTNPVRGIKGITVSPEAPFDNATSPQLSVANTGLDRSGLVNLFNSMPYNVGYIVKGTPTIVDGAISGFSSSNYATLSQNFWFSISDKWEIVICSSRNADEVAGRGIISQVTGQYFSVLRSPIKYSLYISLSGTTYTLETASSNNDVPVGESYFRFRRDGNTLYLAYSSDGTTFINEDSLDITGLDINSRGFNQIGKASYATAYYVLGYINLKKSYIKVNGVTFFNGASAVSQRQLSSDTTVVGSPTISNGYLSGISSNNNCRTSQSLPSDYTSVEMLFNIKRPATSTDTSFSLCGFGPNYNSSARIFGGASYGVKLKNSSNADVVTIQNTAFDFNKIKNTEGIYINLLVQKNTNDYTYTLSVSEDNENWISASNTVSDNVLSGYLWFLNSASGPYNGEPILNLNNTYIKVDGSVWMHGTDPITKTCSVVGCTGTSSLTEEDKNIVLNKGWSLTTS